MIKSKRMIWERQVARMGKKRNAYRIFVGNPERKRPGRRWVDNIKMDLTEMG
jgi:ribosomal protein S16